MHAIIIPAHNEAAVIAKTLRPLLKTSAEIVVVPNGCTDNTAEMARQFGPAVLVVETEIASKAHALNLGDRIAKGWPRFYVDADVQLPSESLQKLLERLDRDGVLAVAPCPKHDVSDCSWAVRAFYTIDSRLPSSQEGIGGSGVYGLSEAGRKRFGEFPSVTADDAFVRRHFRPNERQTVKDAVSIVTPPKTLTSLIAIKTRSHFGNYELDAYFPHLRRNRGPSNRLALMLTALRPDLWPALAVYMYVKVAAKISARWRLRTGQGPRWERDETSRVRAVASGRIAHEDRSDA